MKYFHRICLMMLAISLTGCFETVQTKTSELKNKAGDAIEQVNFGNVNKVMTKSNDFDGSVHKFVKTAAVYRSQDRELNNFGKNAHFALGASWSSASLNNVLLVARQIKPTRRFTRIEFNVNGQVMKIGNLSYDRGKIDETQMSYYNKRNNQLGLAFYQLSRSQFNKIVNDGKAKIRIYYGDGYYNGDLGIEKSKAAIFGLRNLKAAIETK